ncbi:MAG: isoaspartyl peptidase/L-asparaginase family protein [Candidatus Baldrarchaeia archaeon]
MRRFVILCHGGAGLRLVFPENDVLNGIRTAAQAGYEVLKRGGSALDAVETTVRVLEDNPVFNAGTGSALTINGTVEMDASIMDGRTLKAGAVALVSSVKNPISLARIVMEKTDHVLITGRTAELLAEKFEMEKCNPITDEQRRLWEDVLKKFKEGSYEFFRKNLELIRKIPEISSGTVGAVALDRDGNLAAGTSTGGIMLKLPGRIGDSAIIGAGTYAENGVGAASVTGLGEVSMRLMVARYACELLRKGLFAQHAADMTIDHVVSVAKDVPMGIILLDTRGNVGISHSTPFMSWAYCSSDDEKVHAGIRFP